MTLPPGQRRIDGFPRFGTHLQHPPPPVPDEPAIEVGDARTTTSTVLLTELARLPRREMTADFHCVAGWSATDLHWEGVGFRDFFRSVIEPELPTGTSITHVVAGGLDGYRSVLTMEDALADDVLIADRLNGRPLDGDHGAPARLVSPGQYGFISTKHLCRIEVHTSEPAEGSSGGSRLNPLRLLSLAFESHPRARVWREERHRFLPTWAVRAPYRLLIRPIAALCARQPAQPGALGRSGAAPGGGVVAPAGLQAWPAACAVRTGGPRDGDGRSSAPIAGHGAGPATDDTGGVVTTPPDIR